MDCNVDRCRKKHRSHYCRLCEDDDSDHFASECPKSRTLYHGTRIRAVAPIAKKGLKESDDGRLGGGVYFVKNLENAIKISEHRQDGDDDNDYAVVIKCQVYMGVHKRLERNEEDDEWQDDYDSACAMHPKWAGIPVNTSLSLYSAPSSFNLFLSFNFHISSLSF